MRNTFGFDWVSFFMALHESPPSFLIQFTQISQKEVSVMSHLKDLHTDRLDLRCFLLHTNEQRASEDERGCSRQLSTINKLMSGSFLAQM